MKPTIPAFLRSRRRGSALVTALLFTAVLGLLVFPSYLALSRLTLKLSHRSFYGDAAYELAESGLEEAVWALNRDYGGNDPWADWYIAGSDAKRTFSDYSFGGDITGSILVTIQDYATDTPTVLARGVVNLPGQAPMVRYMRGEFSSSSLASTGGGLFAYGMLARDSITASGGCAFDSWNSDPDNDPDTPDIPYSAKVRDDNAKIGCASPGNNSISLGSSDVYGSAAIGSESYAGLNVGWGGQVGPRDSSEWEDADTKDLWKKDPPGWKVSTATGALTTGFTATFEEISVPEGTNPSVVDNYQLPYHTDPNNRYVDAESLGEDDTATILQMDSLRVNAGAQLTIRGDVTLVLPKANQDSLQIIEGGSLVLAEGATLTVYTAGNTVISGAGLVNEGMPRNLQLWGTNSSSQSITFQGSGELSGVIYAPNATITLPGGTNLYGSVVGKDITMAGSGSFHYDESLVSLGGGTSGQSGGGGKAVEVGFVEEISAAEYTALGGS